MDSLPDWGCVLYRTETPDGEPDFQQELLTIWKDPQVRRVARRHAAGDADLAEDGLQEAFYAVARVTDPQRIENLRAFFCTVLIRKIYHLRGVLGPDFPEDPQRLAETGRHGFPPGGPASSRPFDEAAIGRLMAQTWLDRFYEQQEKLRAAVPGRSREPGRYRGLIAGLAEALLRAAAAGEAGCPDSNEALRAAFPEWFDESACSPNTCHQHFRRARGDLQNLLKAIVSRDELP